VGADAVRPPEGGSETAASVASPSRAARAMQFSDYIPVDVERLRPAGSYRQMVESRGERMAHYVDGTGALRPELVEEVPCLLCGADEPQRLFEKEGFTFVQCGPCDFIYVNPQLREDAVRDFYEDEDHSTLIEQLVASSNDYRKERFGKERLDIVESFAKRAPGRLLDVGCTTGFFLEAAAERGWDAHGMELNPYAAQVALAKGLQVRQQMIEEADYEPESFDAVTIFDVVEHVRKPVEMLEKVASLLRPGGVVLLYTPNWDCAERLLLGEDCHFIWATNHLGYFTPKTLGTALERAGFEVEWHETRGLDFEDALWYFEEHGTYDMEFVKRFRHELQFLADAAGHGKNLRMVGRRP
jgi:2-polyprenyl-3-methyl-5-hydroxy-6-metoxy-1,4-benzoquinol methylase